jgi:MFS family permease
MQGSAEPEDGKKPVFVGLLAVFLVYFIAYYYLQTIGVARPRMAADLDGMALYSWAISIPGLAGTLVTLVFSKFSDMYGRRIMLMISLSLFLLGTVLSAISPTFVILIIANTVARLGSGAITPLVFSVLGDMFPPRERSRWVGLLNIPSGILALIGPTLGGWFVDNMSWRHIYWTGVPLMIVCFLAVPIGVPSVVRSSSRKIDVRGIVLMMIASSTMILGFSFAGTTYPWASVQVIGLLGVSLIFWRFFFRSESGVDEPLLDPQVVRNRTFLILIISGMLSNFGLTAMTVYYPLLLQGVQRISAMRSGQIVTPFGVLMAFIGVPAGFLLARTKRYKWMFVMSYAVLTALMFMISFFTAETPILWGVVAATMAGIGWGAIPTIKTLVVQFAVPKRLLGVVTGALFFTVSMGVTIAPAVLGSVMNVAYAGALQKSLPAGLGRIADNATMTSIGNPRVLLSKQAMNALRERFAGEGSQGQALFEQTVEAIRDSMEAGLRAVFLVAAVTMLLSFLFILMLPEISMDVEVEDKKPSDRVAGLQPASR